MLLSLYLQVLLCSDVGAVVLAAVVRTSAVRAKQPHPKAILRGETAMEQDESGITPG